MSKIIEVLSNQIGRLTDYLSGLNSIIARLIGYLFAFGTAIITYIIFYEVALLFGVSDPTFMTTALLTAVIVHEICHLIACEANRVPARMFFLAILGGTMPLWGHEDKLENLSWEQRNVIALAGCVGNFIYMLGALCLMFQNYIIYSAFKQIIEMNSGLIIWNLIPIGFFDGGRFMGMFFDSLPKKMINKYRIAILGGFFIVANAIIWLSNSGSVILNMFIIGLLFEIAMLYRIKQSDPYSSKNPKAIPVTHLKWWATLFLILIALGMISYVLSYS